MIAVGPLAPGEHWGAFRPSGVVFRLIGPLGPPEMVHGPCALLDPLSTTATCHACFEWWSPRRPSFQAP